MIPLEQCNQAAAFLVARAEVVAEVARLVMASMATAMAAWSVHMEVAAKEAAKEDPVEVLVLGLGNQ